MTPHEERLAAEQRYTRTSDRLMQMLLSNRMREIDENDRLKAQLEADTRRRQMEAEQEGLARHHAWAGKGMQIGGMFGPLGAGLGALAGGVAGQVSEIGAREKFAHKYGKKNYDFGDALWDTNARLPKESEFADMAGGFGSLASGLARSKAQEAAKSQSFANRQETPFVGPTQEAAKPYVVPYDSEGLEVNRGSSQFGSGNYGTYYDEREDRMK